MKKSIIIVLIMALSCTLWSQNGYAASWNRVNKVITTIQGGILQGEDVPSLIMVLQDEMQAGDTFYLNLEGAYWLENPLPVSIMGSKGQLEFQRIHEKQLQVRVLGGNLMPGSTMNIPLHTKIIDDEAWVNVQANNTCLSSGRYLFAEGKNPRAVINVGQMSATSRDGLMADVIIEEPFSKAFSQAIDKGASSTIYFKLLHPDYKFDLEKNNWEIEGLKGFDNLELDKKVIRQVNDYTLALTLPSLEDMRFAGAIRLKGIGLEAETSRPERGTVKVQISGDLVETTTLEVLKVADHEVILETQMQSYRSGKRAYINFSLKEAVPDSLVAYRSTDFKLLGGASLSTNEEGKVILELNNERVKGEPIYEQGKVIGFTLTQLPATQTDYQFTLPINLPHGVKQTIKLSVTGRSLIKPLEVPVAEVEPAFKVEIVGAHLQPAQKDQVGGKVAISETQAGYFEGASSIFLEVENGQDLLGHMPHVEVIEGDLRVGTPRLSSGGVEIPILRPSQEASTLVIENFDFNVSGTLGDGDYILKIKGPALSDLPEDVLWEGPFVHIGNLPEEVKPAPVITKVRFKVGETKYYKNETSKMMDVAPYIVEGRTMLPVKYVAEALGIAAHQIKWDGRKKTVTINDGPTSIKLTLGNKKMFINGKGKWMLTAPEIIKGRTFIPIGEIARALKVETYWDGKVKEATLVRRS